MVAGLRAERAASPVLAAAVGEIKALQARRFAGTYADLLVDPAYQPAARFFLKELYSDNDYSDRDAQFARIAGALQKLFPVQVAATAVALAQLHALTEDLDHAMGQAWLRHPTELPAHRYLQAWREVGRRPEREQQLEGVLRIGRELDHLTRMRGLRMMLKMMRGTANAAGMGSLQRFLEAGFDTFASMGKQNGGTGYFLTTVQAREAALISDLFTAEPQSSCALLVEILAKAR